MDAKKLLGGKLSVPVEDPAHRARLEATMEVLLGLPAWEMDADGDWHRLGPGAEDALHQVAAVHWATAPAGEGASLRR